MKLTLPAAALAAFITLPAFAAPFAVPEASHDAVLRAEVVIPPKTDGNVILAAAHTVHSATHLLTVKPLEYVVPPPSSVAKLHSDEYVVPPPSTDTKVHSSEYVVPPPSTDTKVHSNEYVVPPPSSN